MKVFGADPGQKKSGWCAMDADSTFGIQSISFGHEWNSLTLGKLITDPPDALGYEWVKSYGRAVGEDVFRTAYMCGRLRQAFTGVFYEPTRPEIIQHFTGRSNLKKVAVREVLKARFGANNNNYLKGITNHAWDALAVCIYVYEVFYEYPKTCWRID